MVKKEFPKHDLHCYIQKVSINVLGCDKCGHRWLPKRKNIFDSNISEEDQAKFIQMNKPNKCPRCKSPDWDILHRTEFFKEGNIDEKTLKMIAKKYGQPSADLVREQHYKEFAKERINKDIAKIKREIDSYKETLRLAEESLADLEKDLSEVDKRKD